MLFLFSYILWDSLRDEHWFWEPFLMEKTANHSLTTLLCLLAARRWSPQSPQVAQSGPLSVPKLQRGTATRAMSLLAGPFLCDQHLISQTFSSVWLVLRTSYCIIPPPPPPPPPPLPLDPDADQTEEDLSSTKLWHTAARGMRRLWADTLQFFSFAATDLGM